MEVETLTELKLEWFRLLCVAYQICCYAEKYDIHDIVDEAQYQCMRLAYDELYGLSYDGVKVQDLLLVSKIFFKIGDEEYNNCQNILLPFRQQTIVLTEGNGAI